MYILGEVVVWWEGYGVADGLAETAAFDGLDAGFGLFRSHGVIWKI